MIPRRIIRTVPEATTPQVEDWWACWGRLHPGWELVTFRDPLDPATFPLTSPWWPSCGSGAQLAGLVRLEALWHLGGVYVDSDVEPFGAIDQLLGCHAFAGWEDEGVVPDAVIGAEAGHPAIRECITAAIARLGEGPWASGPGVTTSVFVGRDDVVLYPPEVLYPVHYTNRAGLDAYAAGPKPPWSVAMHRWHASWLPPEART